MLDDVREAAIDRALVGDDPEPALALAGVVDGAIRNPGDDRPPADPPDDPHAAVAVAMLTVAAADRRSLDDRAWRPGADPDPRVVAGAAVAVRMRNLAVDRAAALADCTPATLEAVVDRQRRREKECR
ncbi:hypothetical protein DU500_00485 [Haloplanus rubicundus]|uniref:Uncharacterized protein n=1 Tax=Haloplanus rubicundus TaxID=1547898 RepID=A0A345EH25_9EURY|nr:hypothetical protein [Haloplanus rubicundus]AXG05026.1 hypothetical protein DU500_00485 [Haloplanus rubicundus]AXG11497.1 hypothetical protein DU484_17445 [Haloplanus rubicundus]